MALIVINCLFVVTGDEDSDPERSPLTTSDHLLGWPLVTTCGVFASSYFLRLEPTVLGGKGRDGKAKGKTDENTKKKRVDLTKKQKRTP